MSLRLKIADLDTAPKAFQAELPLRSEQGEAWCAERLAGLYEARIEAGHELPFTVSYTAARVGDLVEVKARVQGRLGFACSRCAEPAELTVEASFEHHWVGPGKLAVGGHGASRHAASGHTSRDADADLDDPDVSEHDGVHCDIEPLCIEFVILALPVVPLCSDACLGLCPQCGSNRNQQTCTCAAAPEPHDESPFARLRGMTIKA
jgi:uncharacterized protein